MSLTILDALTDRQLFGALPTFRDLSTWSRWLVFLKATYGLALEAGEVDVFRRHTGRSVYRPPVGGWPEAVCVTGRQSGKTRIAALVVDLEAVTAVPEADGTDLFALLIAQDHRAALRTLLAYARAPFEQVPILAQSLRDVPRTTTVRLSNGVTVAAYPCRPASVRGLRARVVVLDELAFYRTSENLPMDVEMLRAVRPTLATTGGKLVILSSPYGQSGALYELHRRHYGRDDSTTLIWQATASEMNPRPFVWTATVDSIVAKLARCRQTLEKIQPRCTQARTTKRHKKRLSS